MDLVCWFVSRLIARLFVSFVRFCFSIYILFSFLRGQQGVRSLPTFSSNPCFCLAVLSVLLGHTGVMFVRASFRSSGAGGPEAYAALDWIVWVTVTILPIAG